MALIHKVDHPVVDGLRVGRVRKNGSYHLISTCISYCVGNVVIDTGPSNEWPTVNEFYRDKAIDTVLLTHHHEDHSGNGARFIEEFEATLYSHANNHVSLSAGMQLPYTRRKTFGNVSAFTPQLLPDVVYTDNGYVLTPVHVPGHSDDLCCYFEANEGWLFTGDLFVSSRLKYMTIEEDMSAWIDSLQRVLMLDFDTVFCSHRAVILGKEGLAKKLQFFIDFRAKVQDLHKQGVSARGITRKLLGREDFPTYLSHGYMSKKTMVDSALRSLNL